MVGGITYNVHSPQSGGPASQGSRPGRKLFTQYTGVAHTGPQAAAVHSQLSPQIVTHTSPQIATHAGPQTAMHAGSQIAMHAGPQIASQARQHGAGRLSTAQASVQMPTQSDMHDSGQAVHTMIAPQFMLTPDVIAAILVATGSAGTNHLLAENAQPPARRYFLHVIMNTMSDLLISVIKELKAGFKNYILLALCTHKACLNASCSTEAIDTKIRWNDKGEIRLKQKAMTAGRDHYLTTNDFTEIRENFIPGMCRYLVMGEDMEPSGVQATDCVDMFAEFFSVIAARPDYTQDWPSYRGYIIESYASWEP